MSVSINSITAKGVIIGADSGPPPVANEWSFSSWYFGQWEGFKEITGIGSSPMTVSRTVTGTSESIDWLVTSNDSFIAPTSGTLNFGPSDDTLEIPFTSFGDPGSGNSVDVEVTLLNPSNGTIAYNPGIFHITHTPA